LWEWIEIRNTSAMAVNLNGWVVGDRASRYGSANINSSLGNTIVPAGGAAVLYAASELAPNAAQRFADAWGNSINLIPTSVFPSLNGSGGDRIGLWASHADYFVDDVSEPNWTQAVFEIDYATSNGFPGVSGTGGPSIAWSGSGSIALGTNWERSEAEIAGAHNSNATFFPPTQINSSLDRGNPGLIPAGVFPAGLTITEIMYNPASPDVSQEFSEIDFEWIEVLNNTGGLINFNSTRYVLDDHTGSDLSAANIASGSLASGQVGILFNSEKITMPEMQAAWGAGMNYIPVTDWPSLGNDGDTIAIWPSLAAYQSEPLDAPNRSHNNAAAAIAYDDSAAAGWPTDDGRSSIYWNNFAANPQVGTSWTRAGAAGGNVASTTAAPIVRAVADNLGQDVGSPGFVPSGPVPDGDYNGDHTVNAADYTVWRNNLGLSVTLPGDTTPGTVTPADFAIWKANYGNVAGAAAQETSVPEPSTWAIYGAMVAAASATRRRRPALR
jgi:hypothetical protein